jgi:HSP20 family protein
MKIQLWNDTRTLDREIDELFRPFFALPMPRYTGGSIPPVDVFYRDGDLVVHMDLPGVELEKVKVTIERDTLVIRGERERKEKIEKQEYVQTERSYGTFERRILIPDKVDEDQIHAEYRDGVLEITVPLPKEEVVEPRAIPIQAAKS